MQAAPAVGVVPHLRELELPAVHDAGGQTDLALDVE